MYKTLKGFILKDYLLSLLVVISLFPIIITSANLIVDLKFNDEFIGDELMILKLRDKLITSEITNITTSDIEFNIGSKIWNLNYDGERLYLSPGYQLYLSDICDLRFFIKNNILYISYIKNDNTYEKYLKVI